MRSISPPGLHIRPLGLVSWFVGGAFAPTGGAYPSSGGVYPFIGSGFVVCWGCIGAHQGCISIHWECISDHWVWFHGLLRAHMRPLGVYIHPLGVYIRSLVLVSWSAGGVILWSLGRFMAVESLSGSWSAQVPERPTAEGSRLVDPRGCRGVDLCWPSRLIRESRRIGQICAPLRPFAKFWGAGGLAAGWPPGLYIRPLGSVLRPARGA